MASSGDSAFLNAVGTVAVGGLAPPKTDGPAVALPRVEPGRPWAMCGVLLLADAVGLLLAWAGAVGLWATVVVGDGTWAYLWLWPLLGLYLAGYAVARLYPGVPLNGADELRRMSIVTTLATATVGGAIFLSKGGDTYSRVVLVLGGALALLIVPTVRSAVRAWLARPARSGAWWGYPVVILGGGTTARHTLRTLRRLPRLGLRPIAVLDDDRLTGERVEGVPVAGRVGYAAELARTTGIQYAVVAMADLGLDTHARMDLMQRLGRRYRHVTVVPELTGLSSLWVTARDLGGVLGLEVRHRLLDPGKRVLKRCIDLTLIALMLPPLLVVVGVIATLIRLDSRGPIFYLHERVGRGGQRFHVVKFRTMVPDADRVLQDYLDEDEALRNEWLTEHKLRRDPRTTRVGRFLRKTSLDELPQVWNVVRGQMSLIGPRPILEEELVKYGDDYEMYQQVRPGISGLWQVSGRNHLPYDQRVRLDAYYVHNWSVWLDIHILACTVGAVLRGRGAY